MASDRLPARVRGAALILALLVLAVVVMLASMVGSDFMLAFKQVENQLLSRQVYNYLVGTEGIARQALKEDWKNGNSGGSQFDGEWENWAQPQDFADVETGLIGIGQVRDLQGLLNINALQQGPGGGGGTPQQQLTSYQQLFIRLLQTLDLRKPVDVTEAEQITNAVIDWLDKDDIVRVPGGAEDYDYGELTPNARAGNRVFASVTELRMVKGMREDVYRALAPLLRVDGSPLININTAPLPILMALPEKVSGGAINLQPRDPGAVEGIVEERFNRQGLEITNPLLTGAPLLIDTSVLTDKSEYFQLDLTARYAEREYRLHSVIFRNASDNTITVVARSNGDL